MCFLSSPLTFNSVIFLCLYERRHVCWQENEAERLHRHPRCALCHDNVQSNTALNEGGLAAQRTHFSRVYPVNEIRKRSQSPFGIYSGVMLCKFRSCTFLSIIKRSWRDIVAKEVYNSECSEVVA